MSPAGRHAPLRWTGSGYGSATDPARFHRAVTNAVEVAVDVGAQLGEGPCWDAATQTLLWVDIDGWRVHGHTTADDWAIDVGRRPGAVVPRHDGHLVVA